MADHAAQSGSHRTTITALVLLRACRHRRRSRQCRIALCADSVATSPDQILGARLPTWQTAIAAYPPTGFLVGSLISSACLISTLGFTFTLDALRHS